MSLLDQKQLLASIHPFEDLDPRLLQTAMQSMDIVYYPKDTVLISPQLASEHLYIIIKGSVSEYIDDELNDVYSEMDSFDANALIYGKTESRFVVSEELICYEMPKALFMDLLQDNDAFRKYYMEDFVDRHAHLKQRQQQSELTPFMVARVQEIYLHEPCIVDADTPILEAIRKTKALKASSIIVERAGEYGIVTDTNLRDRVLLAGRSLESPIGEVATFPLITIEKQDFLFNALLIFTSHEIKRVAVLADKKIIGILEQLDLLSFFANHSHLVAMQIDKAENMDELKQIQDDMVYLIRSLNSKGVKVRYISKLVNALNVKIYRKVFDRCVPEAYRSECALIVMGSEGRSEQILRTDQDNALIVADGADPDVFEPMMIQVNRELERIGFPPCPGNVMVTNPEWRRPAAGFIKQVDHWMNTFSEASFQAMSIFIDGQCVAGNAALLERVKEHLFVRFDGRSDLLAYLAKAALSFDTPLTLFSNFVVDRKHRNEIDLKKGGIFAIVHGVRTLALEKRLRATNTTERIKELNNIGVLDKAFAKELIEAYDTLLGTRLRARLRHHDKGFTDVNYVDPNELEKIERDLLKDSFKVVNALKKFLTYHFHLNAVV